MPRHFLIGVLIGLLSGVGGCARPGLIVRSEHGTALVDPQQVRPVEYAREDLQEAVAPYSEHLAWMVQQRDSRLRLRLVSSMADPASRPEVDAYLGWCAQRGAPGDCLEVLEPQTPGLSVDAKRSIALRMALASGLQDAAEAIRNVNPVKVEALLVIWFTGYLATLVLPEVITKVAFVIMTANLIAFLGFDGFHSIIEGYRAMRGEAVAAQTFKQLMEVGERYGRRMGPSMVRIVTALVTWGLGSAAGMTRPISGLPGAAQAAANARAQGFHLAAVSSGSVSVSASGQATLVLAMEATANKTTKQPAASGKIEGPVIEESKFAYLFGRASGRGHNIERTTQNASQMRRIGIQDTVEGRALLRAHFDRVARHPSNVTRTFSNQYGTFEIRESLLSGPGGHVKVESTWQVLDGGGRRFITAIPFGG